MIRAATSDDAQAICDLVNYYAERGRMLHRSLESIYESLRDFLICQEQDRLIGCVAISICWKDLGEVRSLAVAPDFLGKGIGRQLVHQAAQAAKEIGLSRIFALTYETKFFTSVGFRIVDREALPTKVWRDCIYCPKADACDEIAMILDLSNKGTE